MAEKKKYPETVLDRERILPSDCPVSLQQTAGLITDLPIHVLFTGLRPASSLLFIPLVTQCLKLQPHKTNCVSSIFIMKNPETSRTQGVPNPGLKLHVVSVLP